MAIPSPTAEAETAVTSEAAAQFPETPFEALLAAGDAAGVRLEIAGGVPTWEAFPSFRHQSLLFRIENSVHRAASSGSGGNGSGGEDCAGVHAADVYIRFPDGSYKRPDLAIFCREPDEQDTAVTLVPEAVIEIVSEGYEAKDWEIGVPFYLNAGVRDVVVLDPATGQVRHFRPDVPEAVYMSPVTLTFACGCAATV